MGSFWSAITDFDFDLDFGKKDARILVLGLDSAGKTTVLYRLKVGEVIKTIPTIGFNVETVQYKNIKFTMWDIGGQDRIRPLWKFYYNDTHAIIFVVDSNDRDRIDEAATELHKALKEPELRDAALLVLANKQDLPNTLNVLEVTEKLGLPSLRTGRQWYVQHTCATTGDGIYEGLNWLSSVIKNRT